MFQYFRELKKIRGGPQDKDPSDGIQWLAYTYFEQFKVFEREAIKTVKEIKEEEAKR